MLQINTPSIFSPHTFVITTADGGACGEIKKNWSGFGQEMFTDADNFGFSLVHFQIDQRVSVTEVVTRVVTRVFP